ncbi:MAG: response regulator [Proteobacteria bacterium]|nr:response regulator [Pseudomonadota bacterium]MBU1059281.1 response regulator [Pseudomonadota bacterium]
MQEALYVMWGKGMDILLVDDDLFNQDLACMLLEDAGHQVTVANNGKIALNELAQHDFEVIFLDMEMPVLNGIETAKIIRSCEAGTVLSGQRSVFPITALVDRYRGKRLAIIAMTGNNDEESRVRCRDAGIDTFLAKPYSLQDFSEVLQHFRQGAIVAENLSPPVLSKEEGIQREELTRTAFEHMKNTYPLQDEQIFQLLEESFKSVQQAMDAIEKGIENKNLALVASASHRLKGTLLGMGLDGQTKLARALELSAKDQEQQESEQLIKELEISVSQLFGKGKS